jgi:hypothetical protein
MAVEPLLLVGLDEPETAELRRRLDRPVLVFETLPRIWVDRGRLLVEHPHFMNHFVPVERVAYHAIFEDDFDFLTALALWGGPCLPGSRGMMDLRLRLPGLVRGTAYTGQPPNPAPHSPFTAIFFSCPPRRTTSFNSLQIEAAVSRAISSRRLGAI